MHSETCFRHFESKIHEPAPTADFSRQNLNADHLKVSSVYAPSNLTHAQELRFRSSIQACKTRAILTTEQAIKIFSIHLANHSSSIAKNDKISATHVAIAFGVSDKAIRDIWKGRTWFHELIHLDPARAAQAAHRQRAPGRPRRDRPPIDALDANDATVKRRRENCFTQPHGRPPSKSPSDRDEPTSETRTRRGSGGPAPYHAPLACSGSSSWSPPHHAPADCWDWADALGPSPPASHIGPARWDWGDIAPHGGWGPASGIPLRESCSQPSYQEAHNACEASTARGLHARVDSPLWGQDWSHLVAAAAAAAAAAEPLPASSRADDPFHDDWARWPAAAAESGPALRADGRIRG